MRYAGVTMCLVFLVGLAALPFPPGNQGPAAAGVDLRGEAPHTATLLENAG